MELKDLRRFRPHGDFIASGIEETELYDMIEMEDGRYCLFSDVSALLEHFEAQCKEERNKAKREVIEIAFKKMWAIWNMIGIKEQFRDILQDLYTLAGGDPALLESGQATLGKEMEEKKKE